MTAAVLGRRALNRATLERQLLLRRAQMPAIDAVHRLVGLQAQLPLDPYTGLWSRLDGFDPRELARLLLERKVVRVVVMRATIHLVTAEDCLVLRPLVQPVLDKELARHPDYGASLAEVRHLVDRGRRAGGRRLPRRAPRRRPGPAGFRRSERRRVGLRPLHAPRLGHPPRAAAGERLTAAWTSAGARPTGRPRRRRSPTSS